MLGPRIPLEIQEHIIEFLESEMTWPNELDPFDNTIIPGLSYHVALRMERCQSLASCSLVCRAWVLSSQKILFSWVCLREAHRLDKFRLMLEAPCSSHLSHYIHRISLVYAPPCYKLGEVIPRLADMELPNLKYLDMACAGNVTPTTITQFPFHRSLVLHALRLQNILHLYLENFQFTHLVELRRLIGIFSGATCFTHLDLRCGNDRLDDFRLFRHATNQRLCKVDPLMAEMGLFRKLNATIWLAGISRTPPRNRTETIKEVSPLLDLDLARFFADIQTKLPVIGTSWWSFDDSHHNWCLTIVTESQGYKLCLNFAVADHVAPSPRTYGGSPVYTLDHISSISLRLQPDIWFPSKNIGIVDEFLAPLHNLQELRFEPSQRIPMHKPASSEVMFGFGQYWAEFLPQTRERCHLEILVGDTVVPWVHLFEQEMTASIEEDYRSQYLRWRNEL